MHIDNDAAAFSSRLKPLRRFAVTPVTPLHSREERDNPSGRPCVTGASDMIYSRRLPQTASFRRERREEKRDS